MKRDEGLRAACRMMVAAQINPGRLVFADLFTAGSTTIEPPYGTGLRITVGADAWRSPHRKTRKGILVPVRDLCNRGVDILPVPRAGLENLSLKTTEESKRGSDTLPNPAISLPRSSGVIPNWPHSAARYSHTSTGPITTDTCIAPSSRTIQCQGTSRRSNPGGPRAHPSRRFRQVGI